MHRIPFTVLGGLILAALLLLPPLNACGAGGLTGSYYRYEGSYLEDLTFSDPGYVHAFDRVDDALTFGLSEEYYVENNGNAIGFDWEPLGPGAGAFGVRWDGQVTVPEYRWILLGTHSDDGTYVYIDDKLFVDNGGEHWPWFKWSETRIGPGTYHITVYLFANDLTPPLDHSGIDLWWSTNPHVVNASGWVPSDWLTPSSSPSAMAAAGTPAPSTESSWGALKSLYR